ncbi:dihydrouridine synthase, DuS [Nostoc sp. NIES-4103]|nr:dihydrouridine synthase, DuS [Nostoc sp. NIES-4103]
MSQVSLPQSLHPELPLTALAPMQDVTTLKGTVTPLTSLKNMTEIPAD